MNNETTSEFIRKILREYDEYRNGSDMISELQNVAMVLMYIQNDITTRCYVDAWNKAEEASNRIRQALIAKKKQVA